MKTKTIKLKTNVKAGDCYLQMPRGSNDRNHNQALKVKTKVTAGKVSLNHNQKLKVKTKVTAGGIGMGNHNQKLKVKTKVKAGDCYMMSVRGSNDRIESKP